MSASKPLTKSLHTVTVVSRLARWHSTVTGGNVPVAVRMALETLGYNIKDFAKDDPTIVASIAATKKLLA